MFERFTERARKVVVRAQDEARFLKQNYIGTEHLLLGIIGEKEGIAAKVLISLNISLDDVKNAVRESVTEGSSEAYEHIPFTPRAKKVLELSLREALQMGHNYIGTEHILLGLLREGEGVAARVLNTFGISLDIVKEKIKEILNKYPFYPQEDTSAADKTQKRSLKMLTQYGRDLTLLAKEGKLAEVRTVVMGDASDAFRIVQNVSAVIEAASEGKRIAKIPYKLIRYRPKGVRKQYLKDIKVPKAESLAQLKEHAEQLGFSPVTVI